ncbi:hypothetical protein Val02_36590 [Virgisporangium aliadipatigenens]|uniref:DUF998 domain-containing protein n=1 Tax=Virgisporangium aliadipatigenens TaxID=741659 RepID=A0A8J3YME4_9ACTN|nr:hypothetical protein [Virgisporangium aliadipatigenens]GIJ46773.1 hypothetical protein Val02_36590 [Virgisporangium aliadipatigenens]
MTTDAVPAGGDPRRLLSDVRALAHRVRLDQRITWVALLVLAVVTFVAIPIDAYSLHADCGSAADWITQPDGHQSCHIHRAGALVYWPPALLLAYGAIAVYAVRTARARGLGVRVLPYVLTGAALTVVFAAAWLGWRAYLGSHPVPTEPFPYWVMLLDRLVAPAGTIGVALLVLARLERNLPLLVFTLGYLVIVLVPVAAQWHPAWGYNSILGGFLPQQILNGVVLLAGAVGFAVARRRQR